MCIPTIAQFHHYPVLHAAAVFGNVELIEFFVQQGAIVETNGWTPLFMAASFGREEVITKLLRLGALIKQDQQVQSPPLLEATKKGHINSMIRLLNAGASPFQRGGSWGQESAFDIAKGEAKKFLDTHCIGLQASPKESALLVALVLNHKELIHCVFSMYLSEGILGAAVNQADSRGRTLFDIAMIRKNELAMPILLMFGADLFSCRLNVLRFASQNPDWKTVKTIDWKTLPIAEKNIQLSLKSLCLFTSEFMIESLNAILISFAINNFKVLPKEIIKRIIGLVMSAELVCGIIR